VHLPRADSIGLMPLHIIDYWKSAKDLRLAKLRWARAKELLVNRSKINRRNGGSSSLVQRVCDALQSISWAGPILGFSDREPIDSLSLYATREWFTDVQQSQMLDHLRTDVLHAGRALEDEICEIWMMEYIRAAWRERRSMQSPKRCRNTPEQRQSEQPSLPVNATD
jgi:hypothetical protein